jgi:hypothetical protein
MPFWPAMAAASRLESAVLPVASLPGSLCCTAAGLLLLAVAPAVLLGADKASTSFRLSAGQLKSVVGLCDLLLPPAFNFADIERLITDALNADAIADAALANDSMLWLTFMFGGLPERLLLLLPPPPILTPKSLPLLLDDPGLPLCLLLGLLLLLLFGAAAGREEVASGFRGLPGLPLPAAVAAPDVTPEKDTDKPLAPCPVLLLQALLAASVLLLLVCGFAVLAAVAPVVMISLRRLTRNQPLPPVCRAEQSRAGQSRAHYIGTA